MKEMTFNSAYPIPMRPRTVVPGQVRRCLMGMLAFFNASIIIFDLALFVR